MNLERAVRYGFVSAWWANIVDQWIVVDEFGPPPRTLRPFIREPSHPTLCDFGRGEFAMWPRDAIHFTSLTFPG